MATIVAFHAHPDDEVLLTGGTLARFAAEGHRVVIVVACDGIVRPEATGPALRARLDELHASAAALGVARVEHLGYADTGHGSRLSADPPGRTRFGNAPVDESAGKLADLLRAEDADLLLSYDPSGGYGHRDHVRVHQVGARAAELTGVRVLEATLPREPVVRLFHALRVLRLVRRYDPQVIATSYSPRSAITHRIDVRRYATHKRAALAAHRSQTHGTGRAAPLFRALAALPAPIFGLLLGREWFVDPASGSTRTTSDNLSH
ncbi:PIG-L domain-containing protein [Actinosynnema sp. ALI-1.44]|nr:PIG-L domain-containing protein [Actinosynnema sp. ALI-1.44]